MVPVQLRYTNVSSWRVASDAQAGGDDAQLVCEHQLCRWQWYCWMFYSAKHLFLSDITITEKRSAKYVVNKYNKAFRHHGLLLSLQELSSRTTRSPRHYGWLNT